MKSAELKRRLNEHSVSSFEIFFYPLPIHSQNELCDEVSEKKC